MGEDETGVDKKGEDEDEINHFDWQLNTLRIVCYLSTYAIK